MLMQKRNYYVNIQARTINVVRNADTVEWEINGTAADAERIQEWFDELQEADESPLGQFFQLGIGSDTQENEKYYEYCLRHLYQEMYALGSLETKRQLEQSGLLVV